MRGGAQLRVGKTDNKCIEAQAGNGSQLSPLRLTSHLVEAVCSREKCCNIVQKYYYNYFRPIFVNYI